MATIPIEVHSVGDLLSTVAAEYLKQGNPSAMLGRVLNAAIAYSDNLTDPDDKRVLRLLKDRLSTIRAEIGRLEDDLYGVTPR